jgi:hypothetical protein
MPAPGSTTRRGQANAAPTAQLGHYFAAASSVAAT